MQSRLGTFLLGLAVAAPLSMALAQGTKQPSKDGKFGKYSHPNLMAADKLCAQAFAKLEAAQVANEYDLGGHAKKAKDLIKQAQDEIKLATVAATKK
ncbi:MAG: hypothetical protein M4D80_41410 [Myxococcota bacterium]|nr:hypothetical protein [Myxococcota bacterium]